MHGAAYKSLPRMVQFLADKGAKIDIWNRKDKYGWTPLLIAEGFRPGNFKPSAETIDAIHRVMRAAGVTPPPPPARSATRPAGFTVEVADQIDPLIPGNRPFFHVIAVQENNPPAVRDAAIAIVLAVNCRVELVVAANGRQ